MSLNPREPEAAAIAGDRENPYVMLILCFALILPILTMGCESAPGDEPEQGAVIGGLAGAAAGAAVAGDDDRLAGAIIGGVIGAGGGYIIGSEIDKDREEEARQEAEKARQNPAQPEQARTAATADLNGNGFVTVDEVIAMERAGLTDEEMIRRLEATGQVFQIGESERRQLREGGVSEQVIDRMPQLNRDKLRQGDDDDGRLDG